MPRSASYKYNYSPILWFIAASLLGFAYWQIIVGLFNEWNERPEYSHSLILPFISFFFAWKLSPLLTSENIQPSWLGVIFTIIAILLLALGRISYEVIGQYSLLLAIAGVIATLHGVRGVRILWAPIVLLMFTIPLPDWFYSDISAKLQLISSRIGIEIIQLFDISVLLEGNIIDMGNYKLQVVEACDGLRYLFPLSSLSFLCAYLFKGKLWMKLVIFFSSIPIAILMNGLRVGITGVLVEYYGIAVAEGFFHDFEGWIIFIMCTLLLMLEVLLFSKIAGLGSFSNAIDMEFSWIKTPANVNDIKSIPPAFISTSVLLLIAGLLLSPALLPKYKQFLPSEEIPRSSRLQELPLQIDSWQGRRSALQDYELTILNPDDHIVINYENSKGSLINLYAAYWYEDSRNRRPHSPQICIPGGGWKLKNIVADRVTEMTLNGEPLIVNRLEIVRGVKKQLVYYWYQQRGRLIRTENSLRLYRYVDKVLKQRSDGAIVRLVTPLSENEDWNDAEQRLKNFIMLIAEDLKDSIPN